MRPHSLLALMLALAAPCLAGPAATTRDLAWMEGRWTAWQDGRFVEEIWTGPRGTVLLGLNRTVGNDSRTSFEFMRIEEREGSLVFVAQPGGSPPTDFPLASLHGRVAVFENPAHDFPTRVVYWIDEHGGLAARIEGPGRDGRPAAMEWHWKRAK